MDSESLVALVFHGSLSFDPNYIVRVVRRGLVHYYSYYAILKPTMLSLLLRLLPVHTLDMLSFESCWFTFVQFCLVEFMASSGNQKGFFT